MVVSYTIRQEQDRSAETAPLIEESIQKVLDVSEEISSLDFYQTLFKNALTESFTDLADSPDAASFSRKVDQLIAGTPVTNVKIYMEVPKDSPSDINALLNKRRPERYFFYLLIGSVEPTGMVFSAEAAFPSFLSLLLSWYKGTKGIWGSGHISPMLP